MPRSPDELLDEAVQEARLLNTRRRSRADSAPRMTVSESLVRSLNLELPLALSDAPIKVSIPEPGRRCPRKLREDELGTFAQAAGHQALSTPEWYQRALVGRLFPPFIVDADLPRQLTGDQVQSGGFPAGS